VPADELQDLRDRAGELELGEEALLVNQRILELDPDDGPAANRVGRCLQELGRLEDALDHWRLVRELQPANRFAPDRISRVEQELRTRRKKRATAAAAPRRDPTEIVEPVLAGSGRDACLRFLAWSIKTVESIDAERLAVTDLPPNRFRVSGGKGSGVTPYRGRLCVFVHADSLTDADEAALTTAGAVVVFQAGLLRSLPRSVEYGVEHERFEEVAEVLKRPHREHLLRSIQAGPPAWRRVHDPALRDNIVAQGV
jgi:tetratricopeptide (TPR) repeat protein